MKSQLTRRELMRMMAAAGLGPAIASTTMADAVGFVPPPGQKTPENKLIPTPEVDRYPASIVNGQIIQPQRPLPLMHEADVLVVGGGPAGFAAAVASARAGAKTALLERYGYLGGQWTGGLVLLVISTHAKNNGQLVQIIRGVGDELLQRLSKISGGIVNYAPNKHNPTSDPEATKFVMDEMIREAGVKPFFHCWGADVVMENGAVRGVVFESKAGRQAILAKVVIDATGDGDIFAAAGAEHEMRLHAIGLVHRLGNVDRVDREKAAAAGVKKFWVGGEEPQPSAAWVNLRGPSTNCLDIGELTRLEMEHRRNIWNRVQKQRQIPGGDKLFLLQTAPQVGVRISRLIAGTHQLTYAESRAGTKFPDVIAVGGAQNAQHAEWQIPYGVMVPKKLDGLLAAGRCVCVDEKLIEDMRLITPCLLTGHAAGAAAALAVKDKCRPRDVDVPKLQKLLKEQGAYLG